MWPVRSVAIISVLLAIVGCLLQMGPVLAQTTGQTSLPLTNSFAPSPGKRPYAAVLGLRAFDAYWAVCSGTLVAPQWILTAAHCTPCITYTKVKLLGSSQEIKVDAVDMIPHPQAFAAPPDCDQMIDELPAGLTPSERADALAGKFEDFLQENLREPNDLALLHLSAPAPVVPAPLLIQPPRGYNPLRDQGDQPVTLIGAGWSKSWCPDPDECGPGILREGTAWLDRYSPTTQLDFSDEKNGLKGNIIPFFLRIAPWPQIPGQAGPEGSLILGGDSGGPMIANVGHVAERVIGVASWRHLSVDDGYHVLTYMGTNADFLRKQIYGAPPAADKDDDGIPDVVDNCPADFNPDQVDFDGDGVGFFCDNCERDADVIGSYSVFENDGHTPSDYAEDANPGQENCTEEAEDEVIIKRYSNDLGDGLPRPYGLDDYRTFFAQQKSSAVNDYLRVLKVYRRGDRCDSNACARAKVRMRAVNTADIQGGEATCKPPQCKILIPTGFDFEPVDITPPGEGAESGKLDLHYCVCDGPHLTERDRRLTCGSLSAGKNCPIDPDATTGDWSLLTVEPVTSGVIEDNGGLLLDAAFGPASAAPKKPSVKWDVVTDIEKLTGQSLPPKPWKWSKGTFEGWPTLRGIVKNSVFRLDGVLTSSILSAPGDPFVTSVNYGTMVHYARSYLPYDPSPVMKVQVSETLYDCHPDCGQPTPYFEEICPVCGFGEFYPWLPERRAEQPFRLVTREAAFDLTHLVDRPTRGYLTSRHVVIPAAESAAQIRANGLTARAAVLASDTLALDAVLSVSGGQAQLTAVKGEPLAAPGARVADAWKDLLAFSAIRGEIFALHPGKRDVQLMAAGPEASRWKPIALEGPIPVHPLAMTYRLQDDSLYVVDEVLPGALQLLRIQVATGAVRTVARSLAAVDRVKRAFAAVTPEGEILVGTSGIAGSQLMLLDVTRSIARPGRAVSRSKELLVSRLMADSQGIHYLARDGKRVRPVDLAWSELRDRKPETMPAKK